MAHRVESKRRDNRGGGPPAGALALVGLVVGIVLGLVYAWVVDPVVITNAAPDDLAPTGQRMWVQMTADSFALNGDVELARTRLSTFAPEEVTALIEENLQEAGGDLARTQRLEQLRALNLGNPGVAAPTAAGGSPWGTMLIACGAGLLALVLLGFGAVLWTRMRQDTRTRPRTTAATRNRATLGPPPGESPVMDRTFDEDIRPTPTVAETEEGADDFDQLLDDTADMFDAPSPAGAVREIDFAEPEPAPVQYSPALSEFVANYEYGNDGYDMSFAIETDKTEFLGECGVAISEKINEGSPEKVTAFEIWLFDKDDIRTVTKVLLSDYAWDNQELRSSLDRKGDLVHVREGDTIDLETKSLRVRARIREADYGDSNGKDNAYFERLVVELTPQQKQ